MVPRAQTVSQSPIRAITRRVEAVGGINLGQGTCALPPHPEILAAAWRAMAAGHNSYTFYDGVPALKQAVARRVEAYNGLEVGADQVLVTSGATGGLECICKCFLEPGDEVIVVEPVYGYHVRLVVERGGVPRYLELHPPDWAFDPRDLDALLTRRTKLLLFSNPNNPSGKVFRRDELLLLGEWCQRHDVIAVVDEVYEYLPGPGASHVSLASLPGMFEHTLTISSASKTLFVTGWRVGWVIGPADALGPIGVKSDETYVCAPAPLQHAVAEALNFGDPFFEGIRAPFHARRERLCDALTAAGLRPFAPQGAYYVLADYRALGYDDDDEASAALVDRVGVGSVPGWAFFPTHEGRRTGLLRFCFALVDDELERACRALVGRSLRSGDP